MQEGTHCMAKLSGGEWRVTAWHTYRIKGKSKSELGLCYGHWCRSGHRLDHLYLVRGRVALRSEGGLRAWTIADKGVSVAIHVSNPKVLNSGHYGMRPCNQHTSTS